MEIKHNPKVEKLSEAMVLGEAIAKERGIDRTTGEILQFDAKGKINCACAVGFALIGKKGVRSLEMAYKKQKAGDEYSYFNSNALVHKEFPQLRNETTECLLKTITPKEGELIEDAPTIHGVYEFIYSLNDMAKTKVKSIASKLKRCGL